MIIVLTINKNPKALFYILGIIFIIAVTLLCILAQKNELIITDISYSDFESILLDEDKFMDYSTSLGDNLSYEEVITLSENYTYKK